MKSTVISCAVEGNIMIALHASKSVGKVVIVLKEPDILMLLIQSCSMCTISKEWLLTLFRMGIFGAAHGWGVGEGGVQRPPSLKSVTHILQ